MITELNSRKVRALVPENDPPKIGMGWAVEDLDKLQIMVESTFGDSHPGSTHLDQFVNQALKGVADAGGKGARYLTTDIYDDISQGHDGISYSLAHRDMIANVIEVHGKSTGFDGGVFIASCDKSVPTYLMGLGRLDMPSIVITGGVMDAGPDLLTLEQIDTYSAMCQRGEITEGKPTYYKHHACSSCGACSFMGTASTVQATVEALGLMPPDSVLMPATCGDLKEMAYKAGVQVMELARKGIKTSDIMTMKSFENAIMVHVATSGSINSLLHIPAITHEFGLEINGDTFGRMHRGAHYPLGIRPAGKQPAQFFCYAGDVPAVVRGIRSMLHLDVMTVTDKTLGENLEELKNNGFYDKCEGYLEQWGLKRTDMIRTLDQPVGTDGTVIILRDNLAPEGAVAKHSTVPKEMPQVVLRARPFNCEEDAIEAVIPERIKPGDAVFIRYERPKGSDVPEMFYTKEAISSDPELDKIITLITDGWFSDASKGLAIGHVSPEAAQEGPIALVEEDNLIRADVPTRVLKTTGVKGEELPKGEIDRIPAERKKAWKPMPPKYTKGMLKIFLEHAVSPMEGGYMVQ